MALGLSPSSADTLVRSQVAAMGVSGNRQRSSLGESDAAKARWEPHALLETNLEKILLALGSLPDETRARVVRVLYKTFVSPQVSSV